MKDHNLLTQKLLAAGYTTDHYPDYVRLPGGSWGEDPLKNLHGGFEYTHKHLSTMVFETGCGLLVKGSKFSTSSMGYMGITWIPENDNPVICCPYRQADCNLRHPFLQGMVKLSQCNCHQTQRPYDYEKSVDKVTDDEERERQRKYEEFTRRKNGHACYWHCRYNYWTGIWSQDYDPMICAKMCNNIGRNCDLTHKPISKKKGNVFYDVKISHVRHDDTLFNGQIEVRIEKGVRLFETMKSMTICEAAARRIKYIKNLEEMRNPCRTIEILNIRAERRESRDLLQDLQDIKEGIQVIHASDLKRDAKEEKKKRRQKNQEKKIKKLEQKIIENGFESLDPYSVDFAHARKWLKQDRIKALERIREEKIRQEREKPVQMDIFDFINTGEKEGSGNE